MIGIATSWHLVLRDEFKFVTGLGSFVRGITKREQCVLRDVRQWRVLKLESSGTGLVMIFRNQEDSLCDKGQNTVLTPRKTGNQAE